MKSEPYNTPLRPAPWQLTGRGYTFVYRFAADFIQKQGMIPQHLQPHYVGGFGALMLVDYTSSDCGPYHELLFIPGGFRYHGHTRPSISRIFVSSMASVVNGQRNWGIPKDQADFQVKAEDDGSETWIVRYQGSEIFRARIKGGVIPLPVHSALLPSTLMQSWQQKVFFTRLSAHGHGRPAKLLEVKGDGQHFPDLSLQKPFLGLGVKLDAFQMTFHEPKIEPEVRG